MARFVVYLTFVPVLFTVGSFFGSLVGYMVIHYKL